MNINRNLLKPLLGIITLALVAGILVLSFIKAPYVYGYMTSPKFSKLDYDYTHYVRQSKCFLVCQYTPHYNYQKYGSQKVIANSVIEDLNKQGYQLKNPSSDSSLTAVRCYGDHADDYFFIKSDAQQEYPGYIQVTFHSGNKQGHTDSSEIGCLRPVAEYRIEVLKVAGQ